MEKSSILHVARLSKLCLSEEEVTIYSEQFQKIMELLHSISTVDTSNFSPMHHPFDEKSTQATLREDTPSPINRTFTTEEDPYFYVPKVIE